MKELSFLFFIIGLWGFLIRSSTFITSLVGLEMIFVSLVYGMSILSIELDDLQGQIMSLSILAVAAAESAVALAILVQYYRVRGAVETFLFPTLKG